MGKDIKAKTVGSVATALRIAGRMGAFIPGAAAGFAVAGLVGDAGDIAKRYFERRQKDNEERVEALTLEVLDRRLANVEDQIEIDEDQIDLAAHVFERMLQDDEASKERFYGAILEMVLRKQIDTQSFKILLSAVSALARIELEEFEFTCDHSGPRYHFRSHKLSKDEAPTKRDHHYRETFTSRLQSVCLVQGHTTSPSQREVTEKGELPKTSYAVTSYGLDFLFAVTGDEREEPPTSRVVNIASGVWI